MNSGKSGRNSSKKMVIVVTVLIFFGLLLLGIAGGCILNKMLNRRRRTTSLPSFSGRVPATFQARGHCSDDEISASKEPDLPFFDIETILAATDNLAIQNKIGDGGFGDVYQVRTMK